MNRWFSLCALLAGCTPLLPPTTGTIPGGGHPDSGASTHDAGTSDAGTSDAGSSTDAGLTDGGADAGSIEGAPCTTTSDCRADLACASASHVCERCVSGEACGDGGVCFSSFVGPNAPRACGYGANNAPCFSDTDCLADHTCEIAVNSAGSWKWCRCTGASCPPCLDDNQLCDGGVCHADGGALACTPGQNGDPCQTSANCVAGGTCFTQAFSGGSRNICTDGQPGSPCGDAAHCASLSCSSMTTAGGVVSTCD